MQVKDDSPNGTDDARSIGGVMIGAILIAANMCLQGGTQVDISRDVAPTTMAVELKVTLLSATGTLLVYSPGYEAQQA
jgi:hypothetical protein